MHDELVRCERYVWVDKGRTNCGEEGIVLRVYEFVAGGEVETVWSPVCGVAADFYVANVFAKTVAGCI